MKILLGTLVVAASAGAALAQEAKTIAPAQTMVDAKIALERAQTAMKAVSAGTAASPTSTDKIVKNSPFSAEAVSESVQTLADGNRIVRNSTSKLYRNSEGRFRREIANGSGGLAGSVYTYNSAITILDPVVGFRYTVDPNLKTVRSVNLKPSELKVAGISTTSPDGKLIAVDRLKTDLKVVAAPSASVVATPGVAINGVISAQGQHAVYPTAIGVPGVAYPAMHTKYETRTEKLGVQNFEGVDAEGTRTTTTIPAGAIGNERPIETIYESWYSGELQLVVFSRNSDPRFGEQTYKLTNIVRSEPDPSLFSLPTGYKVIGTSTTAPATRALVERASATRTSQPAATYVKNTKP